MPHPAIGTLRAYLDGELAREQVYDLLAHLYECTPCCAALDRMRLRGREVTRLISTLERRRSSWRGAIAATTIIGAVLATTLWRAQPHVRTVAGARVQDVCCFNLDGGDRRDDGMLTVSRPGQVVDCVVLYEDAAGKGAFSPQDPLRFVSRPQGCAPDELVATLSSSRVSGS